MILFIGTTPFLEIFDKFVAIRDIRYKKKSLVEFIDSARDEVGV
jgi:hypothetical protein